MIISCLEYLPWCNYSIYMYVLYIPKLRSVVIFIRCSWYYNQFYKQNRVATIVLPDEYEDRWTRISVIINTGSASVYMDGQPEYQSFSVSASTLTSGSILQLYVVGSTGMVTKCFIFK